MIFSDFYINKTTKVEILPTDSIDQDTNVLEQGDRLISIFRPIGSHSVMDSIRYYFIEEFELNYKNGDNNISKLLLDTVNAFASSLVNPPADFKLSGEVELLIIYENSQNELFVVKVGSIQFKQRVNGKFISSIKDSKPLSAQPDTEIMVGVY
jgi:hypothetical protein